VVGEATAGRGRSRRRCGDRQWIWRAAHDPGALDAAGHGGFAGDAALRGEHIHPWAANLPLRANPKSVGDGLRLGLVAGAAFGPPNAGFYGHLIPSKVAYNNPYEFTDLTFYHSEHGCCSTSRASGSATRQSETTSTRSTCPTSQRRALLVSARASTG
jgi:hypothetical protein